MLEAPRFALTVEESYNSSRIVPERACSNARKDGDAGLPFGNGFMKILKHTLCPNIPILSIRALEPQHATVGISS